MSTEQLHGWRFGRCVILIAISAMALAAEGAAPIDPGCAGSLDPSFDPGSGLIVSMYAPTAGWIQAVVVQPDGKVLVGGTCTEAYGFRRNGLARLNSDGSLDTDFAAQPHSNLVIRAVRAIALQQGGHILIGGRFDTAEGAERYGFA